MRTPRGAHAAGNRNGRDANARAGPWEHMFVTSQGSPYLRFRRALATGNLTIIRAAAAELPYVELDDALRIAAVMAAERHRSYQRAACRWLARFALERPVTLEQIRQAVLAFQELPQDPSVIGRLELLARD